MTHAWFAQCDFTDLDILHRFQESLAEEKARDQDLEDETNQDQSIGLSLRELIREFKWQTLVLFKCCLLQPKVHRLSHAPSLSPGLDTCLLANAIVDALLRVEMRSDVHDSVLPHLSNPRPHPQSSRLRRSRTQRLRVEVGEGDKLEE